MMIERWSAAEHAALLGEWMGMSVQEMDLSLLPSIGFIVDRQVAGFLYLSDSTVAHLGHLWSDPKSTGASRAEAMDVLTAELLRAAKASGAKLVVSMTAKYGVIERAKRFGFKTEAGMTLLTGLV